MMSSAWFHVPHVFKITNKTKHHSESTKTNTKNVLLNNIFCPFLNMNANKQREEFEMDALAATQSRRFASLSFCPCKIKATSAKISLFYYEPRDLYCNNWNLRKCLLVFFVEKKEKKICPFRLLNLNYIHLISPKNYSSININRQNCEE